jgi:serine kinase of HPr protein (carbohydrate metabolism regulator)
MAEGLLVHGTAVAIGERAVLLRGPSGSGKSDLALRLIDAGALLVADDQCRVWVDGGAVMVRAPAPIAGLIEARGVGILQLDFLPAARLSLIADLVASDRIERLPDPCSETILDVAVPVVAVAPFETSAAAKLRFALGALAAGGTLIGFER